MVQTFLRNVWKDVRLPMSALATVARLPMSALATVARKSFNGKFTTKIDFPIGHFMLQLLMPTLQVKSKVSPYII